MTLPSSLRLKSQDGSKSQPVMPSSLKPKKSPKKEENFLETIDENIKEIPSQASKGFITGATSAYGNVLDILNLQSKETLPAEKQKRLREFDTLGKLEKGEIPSIAELSDLSDDEILPLYSRLPTSPESREFLEEL